MTTQLIFFKNIVLHYKILFIKKIYIFRTFNNLIGPILKQIIIINKKMIKFNYLV